MSDQLLARCDFCDQKRPPKFWKVEKANPAAWSPSDDPACLAVFCCLECATKAETASRDATAEMVEIIHHGHAGRGAACAVWRRLLETFPEPLAVASDDEAREILGL